MLAANPPAVIHPNSEQEAAHTVLYCVLMYSYCLQCVQMRGDDV